MFALLKDLWKHRDRPRFPGREWIRLWARRFQQLPSLLKQGWFQVRLLRKGAKVSPTCFFSDSHLISGKLANLQVGAHTFVGRVELSVHAQLVIGSCVCINDGVKILTASHDVTDPGWRTITAPVLIEDHVWIATNAIILPGVTLGRGAVVGAGAVVAKNVPPLGIVVGNPAVLMKKCRTSELFYHPTNSLALFRAWRSSTD